MKLLIATGLYAPDIGGPATYTEMLEKRLPEHGIELSIIPFRSVRSYPKLIRHVVYFWHVFRAAKDVDAVYALDPISVGLPALCAAKLRKKKFMLRLGGDYAWEQGRVRFGLTDTLDEYTEHKKTAPFFVRCLAWLQSFVTTRAHVVVAPSEYLKSIIVTWGVKPERVRVIYSSLVPTERTLGREVFRQKEHISGITITTAGRLVPWKGMRTLIAAVADLKERFPDIILIIIGDGTEQELLESLVQKHGLEKHVRFTGRLSKVDLVNTIHASDVFVLNTAYEGLSHQLLEVMDIGVPIVTTTAGGNTELLTDGVDSFLIPFNDRAKIAEAITTIVTNPETSSRLVQFARARSKDFSEDVVITQLRQLLQQVYEA